MEMTPIVVGGVMYVTTGDDDALCTLHATTGKQIWAYHPTDMPPLSTLPICCNNDNRGVAVGNGKVFNARLDATLVALDAKSGKVVWKTTVDLPSNGAAMTLAPQFADNKVIVGVSGAEYGVRGHVDAYDPDTGNLVWRFWTTEPTTWAGDTYLHGAARRFGNPQLRSGPPYAVFQHRQRLPMALDRRSRGNELIFVMYRSGRCKERAIELVFPRCPPRHVGL